MRLNINISRIRMFQVSRLRRRNDPPEHALKYLRPQEEEPLAQENREGQAELLAYPGTPLRD
eukprot:3269173-Pyramimonas_sp.AAC.2